MPRLDRQIVKRLCARRRLLPARQRLVRNLDLRQNLQVGGKAIELLTVEAVGGCDLELVKVVEDVELGQVDGGVVIAGVRMLNDDEVEPAAPALAAGGDTDFVADGLELFADGVELFGGERAAVGRRC